MSERERNKWIAVGLLALFATACEHPAMDSVQHGDFTVERLFVEDGCTVYRFLDGSYRYFVKCADGATASASWSESCGKNCLRGVEVPTGVYR